MIKIWYAVDEDGMRNLCLDKPSRFENYWIASKILTTNSANAANFPALTWDDEPVELELYTKAAVINELKQLLNEKIDSVCTDALHTSELYILKLITSCGLNPESVVTLLKLHSILLVGDIAEILFDEPKDEK